jgi:hypothetical protein
LFYPPNHDFNDVDLVGVTDPGGDSFTIHVLNVMQDEGVLGGGGRKSCPDVVIEGERVLVRLERAVNENGRIDKIRVSALDSSGASRTVAVRVCMPHESADSPTWKVGCCSPRRRIYLDSRSPTRIWYLT